DQARLRAGVPLDDLHALLDTLAIEAPSAEHLRPAEDCRQRGPQLVGDRDEELVLGAVRLLCLAARGALAQEELLPLLLDMATVGDVDARPRRVEVIPLLVEDHLALVEDPVDAAVRPYDAVFGVARGARPRGHGIPGAAIVGVNAGGVVVEG